MSSVREESSYDVWLSYGGNEHGFLIHDNGGSLSWWPGLAPDLQPQFKTGSYGYENVPSQVDIPISFEDWSLGAGFYEDPAENPSQGPRGYSHTRHVDLSYGPAKAYLALAVNDEALPNTSDKPAKIVETTLGIYCLNGPYINEFSSGAWVERFDSGGGDVTDLYEFDGNLFAAVSGAAYEYSADGTSWTTSTLSSGTPRPLFWAHRDDVLWYVNVDGLVANSNDPVNGGSAWSSEDAVGHTSESVRGFIEVDDDFYIFKEEGFYRYTGTATEDVWLGGAQMRRTTNGHRPFLWGDQRVYVPYGNRLLFWDAQAGRMGFVWPTNEMAGHPELSGQIGAVTGDEKWLYLSVKNAAGDTYLLAFNPYRNESSGEAHTVQYLGANDCEALLMAGPNSTGPSSTNKTLWLGDGTAGANYIIYPQENLRPEDDSAVSFTTEVGVIYGGYGGFGAMGYPKFLNGGRVMGENLSLTEYIRLSYEVDESSLPVEILTATDTGLNSDDIDTEVEFLRARVVVELATGAATETPILNSAILHATPNPPRKRKWIFVVRVADQDERRNGGLSSYSAKEIEEFLFGAVQRRVTMIDKDGTSFFVRILNIQGLSASADLTTAQGGAG